MEILLLEKNYDICEIKQRNKKSKKSYIWKIWKGKINLRRHCVTFKNIFNL